MSRLVILLLIGVLTLFSAPRAGMTYEQHETSGHDMSAAVQDSLMTAHQHDSCPDCLSPGLHSDIPCPHGLICVLFTPTHELDHRVSRTLEPMGFPVPPFEERRARVPALDVPPPRIGFSLT